MTNVWEKLFKKKKWGEYPPEDLIRFISRHKKKKISKKMKVLEVGCGTGANLKFLKDKGFDIYGIDISQTAIKKVKRLMKKDKANFKNGNFSNIPWPDDYFDGVIDNFSVYANKISIIKKTYSEIYRVLKKKGFFFSKVWGTKTQGYRKGKKLEHNTFQKIKIGPCKNMGVTHFFTYKELKNLNKIYRSNLIDKNFYSDKSINKNYFVEIFISQSYK